MTRVPTASALVLCLAASGCARPDPPLLTLSGRACDAAPVLDGALAVPFDDRSGVTAVFDATSLCLDTGNGRAVTYAVFRLPDVRAPYQVTIMSEAVGNAVVSPRAQLYDGSSHPVRTLGPDTFRMGISGFTAGLRTQPDDRLLLVSADPATVGQPLTLRLGARETGTQVAATVFIPIIVAVPVNDQVRQQAATLSLNGRVRVSAAPIRQIQ